jgi:DNA-binding NtrC family response regulator
LSQRQKADLQRLAPLFFAAGGPPGEREFRDGEPYRESKARFEADFERRYVQWLLQRTEGNISRAARVADMDRKYLHKLLKKHDVES